MCFLIICLNQAVLAASVGKRLVCHIINLTVNRIRLVISVRNGLPVQQIVTFCCRHMGTEDIISSVFLID